MKLFYTVLLSFIVTIINSTIANGCFKVERDALLTFKAGLHDPGNLMSSWHGQDCCNWNGVTCDYVTKHVVKLNLTNPYNWYDFGHKWKSHALAGEINSALLSLKQLTNLDLISHDFSNISIPKFFGYFQNLVYLNLSFSYFQDVIPHEFGNLSRLQFLDLSYCQFTGLIPPQLGNLSELQYLSFGYSSYSSAIENLSWLYRLSNLRYLDLSLADLNNKIDWSKINKLQMLQTLILSECYLSKIPTERFHVNLTALTKLDLSYNSIHVIPNWLWNLTSLLYLDISNNLFHRNIPSSLTNLASLNYLNIGENNFQHVILEPISKLNNLRRLELSYLNIGGDIDNLIKSLGSMWYELEVIDLTGNNLSGSISSWIVAQMKNLSIIYLDDNYLSGPITSEMGTLTQLKELSLSYNSLYGVITKDHFLNLLKLEVLDLSHNMLTIKPDDKWIPPFQLRVLFLGSCKIGPRFPEWLKWQKQLVDVKLSNASIVGVIPIWFWNLDSIESIDLSYNNIKMPYKNIKSKQISYTSLDLSNNNIYGHFPDKLEFPNLSYLSLSNNIINGSITYSTCDGMPNLQILDLSNNFISGEIPNCWKNISNLIYIDLSKNYITGELPTSIGSLQNLQLLQLYNNKLYGEIPSTLRQCNKLGFLALGKNNFSGKIPTWIGKQLQNLVVFQLRSNKFKGSIPSELGELKRLQILDLSDNALAGSIPKSIGNYSSMKNSSEYSYYTNTDTTSLYVDINGQHVYTSSPLELAKTIDISRNNLNGQIPEEIWLLDAVINLNLSENILVGEISENIGGMRSLESLDLSFNDLSGPIPQSLSNLSSLHNMNLSYNNFSGKIPTGRQLDTINVPSIYIGNSYLCGPPTTKNCSEDQASRSINFSVGDNERDMVWFYLVFALGFILGFWSLCGVLIFQNTWKAAYFEKVDRFFDKIYVHVVLAMRRFG